MALKKKEAALLEAVSGMLSQKAKVGLHNLADNETSHTSQFRWEGIDDAYALKVSDLTFFESVTSAFFQVHSYKYIDHPTFKVSFVTELKNRAVPQTEVDEAVKAVDSLITELSAKTPTEKDAGWNPNLKEIMDMTRNADDRTPSKEAPFTGGGPWAEHDESFVDLMIIEGTIPNKDAAPYALKFRKLQDIDWTAARPHMVRLVSEASEAGYADLSSRVESYIDAADSKTLNELWTPSDSLKARIRGRQFPGPDDSSLIDDEGEFVGRDDIVPDEEEFTPGYGSDEFVDTSHEGAYDHVCGLCDSRFTDDNDMLDDVARMAAKDPAKPEDICPQCWANARP